MHNIEGGDPYNNIRGFMVNSVKRFGRVEMRKRALKLIASIESNDISSEDKTWLERYKRACREVIGGEF